MGFRFRKQIKLLPGVRLNISKSGISTSIGTRGATVNFSKRGTRTTFGIPGTGISYSTTTGRKRSTVGRRSLREVEEKARMTMINQYGLTRREANRFVKDAKKHPKRLLGLSDEAIVKRYTQHRLTPNGKIFLLLLLLSLLVYTFINPPVH